MINFILLTPVDETRQDRINIDQIILYRHERSRSFPKTGSMLILTHGHSFSVIEPPETIDALIAAADTELAGS